MSEMKFDRARFDAGEMPTRTRNGSRVLWCADSGLDIDYPVVAIIEGYDSIEYTRDGKAWANGPDAGHDLVHESKMRTLRIAVCRNIVSGGIYTTDSGINKDFDSYVAERREDGRLLHLIEVEVPE